MVSVSFLIPLQIIKLHFNAVSISSPVYCVLYPVLKHISIRTSQHGVFVLTRRQTTIEGEEGGGGGGERVGDPVWIFLFSCVAAGIVLLFKTIALFRVFAFATESWLTAYFSQESC